MRALVAAALLLPAVAVAQDDAAEPTFSDSIRPLVERHCRYVYPLDDADYWGCFSYSMERVTYVLSHLVSVDAGDSASLFGRLLRKDIELKIGERCTKASRTGPRDAPRFDVLAWEGCIRFQRDAHARAHPEDILRPAEGE